MCGEISCTIGTILQHFNNSAFNCTNKILNRLHFYYNILTVKELQK
jgi:hypothetical protein